MKTRTLVSIACLIVVVLVLCFRSVLVPVVGTVLAAGCTFEVCRAFRGKGYRIPYAPPIALSLVMFVLYRLWGIWALAAAFGLCLLAGLVLQVLSGGIRPADCGVLIFTLLYPNVGFIALMLLNGLQPESMALLGLGTSLLGAGLTDIFAFVGGKYFGRHKFFPTISPNKTDEGAICGVVGGVAAVLILRWVLSLAGMNPPISYPQLVLVGMITSILGQLGDLAASAIKRYVDIKDFSSLLGSHGGLTDRMDSTILAAVGVYIMLVFMV